VIVIRKSKSFFSKKLSEKELVCMCVVATCVIKMANMNKGIRSGESYCVVDLSYYFGIGNVPVVKELAVSTSDQQQSWVFMAPYFWDELTCKTQQRNAVLHDKGGVQFK